MAVIPLPDAINTATATTAIIIMYLSAFPLMLPLLQRHGSFILGIFFSSSDYHRWTQVSCKQSFCLTRTLMTKSTGLNNIGPIQRCSQIFSEETTYHFMCFFFFFLIDEIVQKEIIKDAISNSAT